MVIFSTNIFIYLFNGIYLTEKENKKNKIKHRTDTTDGRSEFDVVLIFG